MKLRHSLGGKQGKERMITITGGVPERVVGPILNDATADTTIEAMQAEEDAAEAKAAANKSRPFQVQLTYRNQAEVRLSDTATARMGNFPVFSVWGGQVKALVENWDGIRAELEALLPKLSNDYTDAPASKKKTAALAAK